MRAVALGLSVGLLYGVTKRVQGRADLGVDDSGDDGDDDEDDDGYGGASGGADGDDGDGGGDDVDGGRRWR
eukprot:4002826-Pyramimonas_sp.AAC.1